MSRDDYAQQGKQFVSDLRDTVSKKVADNEHSIRGTVGKAARWIDQKTGGKYADSIAKAESSVGDGIGKVAAQSSPPDGTPHAPGAAAGDPAEAGTGPVTPPAGQATGPVTPAGETTTPVTPPPGQTTTPVTPPPGPTTTPVTPPRDDSADWPRPPR